MFALLAVAAALAQSVTTATEVVLDVKTKLPYAPYVLLYDFDDVPPHVVLRPGVLWSRTRDRTGGLLGVVLAVPLRAARGVGLEVTGRAEGRFLLRPLSAPWAPYLGLGARVGLGGYPVCVEFLRRCPTNVIPVADADVSFGVQGRPTKGAVLWTVAAGVDVSGPFARLAIRRRRTPPHHLGGGTPGE
ncbi:MAG: hypothetical protein AAF211_13630 [Myxococcota bacterium]